MACAITSDETTAPVGEVNWTTAFDATRPVPRGGSTSARERGSTDHVLAAAATMSRQLAISEAHDPQSTVIVAGVGLGVGMADRLADEPGEVGRGVGVGFEQAPRTMAKAMRRRAFKVPL